MTDTLELLDARRSTPSRLLTEPGPSPEQIQRLLRSAVRVPDHGKLEHWRFLSIQGDARLRLGELLVERTLQRDPGSSAALVEKERQRFAHAPIVLAVIARIQDGHRIPAQEQWLSAGCVCFSLLLGAQALGFGAQWLTGWAATDAVVKQRLGLAEEEHIVGFIHIGTRAGEVPERARPDPANLLSEWRPGA